AWAVAVPAAGCCRALAGRPGPLPSTSANPPWPPPARSAREVAERFPDGIDLIVDGGEVAAAAAPSALLDLRSRPPRLLRNGPPEVHARLLELLGRERGRDPAS